jgi:hypothetical protein
MWLHQRGEADKDVFMGQGSSVVDPWPGRFDDAEFNAR